MSDAERIAAESAAWDEYRAEHGYATYPTEPDTGADFHAGFTAAWTALTQTALAGATTPGEMNAWPSNPGEFAARWNAATEQERADRLTGMIDASERSLACFLGGHLDHIAALEAKIASAKAVTAEEPMIVSAMRRQPTGEVRYLSDPKERGMLGTSTRGFLHELDEWAAQIKREAAAEALDRASADCANSPTSDPGTAWFNRDMAMWLSARAAEIREGKS